MSKHKRLAENNINRALETSGSTSVTYATIALAYATLNQDNSIRKLELTLSRLIDAINRSTNFR